MKKITKNRLAVQKETLRKLDKELGRVQGGITGLACNSDFACPTHTCPSMGGPCTIYSRTPGC